jgi:YbbR domain-containing protein
LEEGKEGVSRKMSKVNVPFAILSLATSVLLWASVYNDRNDKPTPKTETVPLTIRDLDEKLVITNMPSSVSLQLSGYARDFRTINQQAKTAIVDLKGATVGEKDYPVVVFPTVLRELLGNSVPTAKIKIDKLVTKKVDVIPITAGTLMPGVRREPIDTYPHWIYVTGPSELVEKVVSIQVLVNLSSVNTSPQEFDLDPRPVDIGNRPVSNIMLSDTESHPNYIYNAVENTLKVKATIKYEIDAVAQPKK